MTRTFALNIRVAQALKLPFLQDPQELGLCGCTHLADFVEKQHSARRQFDLSRLGLLRAGNAPRS